ncbi:MAG: hypothetical protein ACO1N5_09895, partial [Noviherbaspirillum sp.]
MGEVMSMYAVDAVRMNAASGRVEKVRWGKLDYSGMHWELEPMEGDVAEVVDKIQAGDEVRAAFPVGNFTVLGPRLEVFRSRRGEEEIEVEDADEHPGRTISDMPTF